MGQTIEVTPQQVGSVVIFDTDRSITGQDGSGYGRPEGGEDHAAAGENPSFPAQLAGRLFAGVDDLDHIFVVSNQVVVERRAGWTDGAIAEAADIISQFFRYYPD